MDEGLALFMVAWLKTYSFLKLMMLGRDWFLSGSE